MTPQWRKSSRSGGVDDKACVEVAELSGVSWIRNAKPTGAGHHTPARTRPAVPTRLDRDAR